jgi:hypothetical protein
MKRRRRNRSRRLRVLHLWDWKEVLKALPYLRSVTGSLREHYLDVLNVQRRAERAAQNEAPSKRQELIDTAAREDEMHRAQTKFDDALEELNRLDVFLLDPVQGLALLPFRKEDELAWYIFDHFAKRGIMGWRFHADPIEECRPLSTLPKVKDSERRKTPAAPADEVG